MALILVTGASAGLGLATVTSLARAGHDVVLHARRPGRVADPALRGAMRAVVYGDLGDLEETVSVAQQANEIGRFDAVIHNAGVLRGPEVMAVNAVAPYVLTALMAPPARLVYLSSSMHLSGSADLRGLDPSRARGRAYEDSKLYVTALAMAYARLRPDSMAHAVDPGWVPTRMGGPGAPDDLDEGHRAQEWLATADAGEITPRSGGYWRHGRARGPHPAATDPGFQDALLRRLEAYTGIAPAVG
ncbi:SDR family NAD(P)-dependent oxidoreductase [Sinomonas mesophila]|uniref:SDR family NAD(P)-dependent oxidoreductase n=1 Tax=Sinomonas mesophila TaxID=1531955 RepID=UPI0009874636|nr:SDR family NAD(P)-dependent oxidoreductase [Sinomonas mesophila]